MLTKPQLVDLIENRYFAAIDGQRIDETLACLAPDCVWNIFPAGTRLAGRDTEIRAAFETAFERYPTMWHGNFDWIVDQAAQRVAAIFDVRLLDREGRETLMKNTKLFRLADGRFSQLDLYFSTSETIVA